MGRRGLLKQVSGVRETFVLVFQVHVVVDDPRLVAVELDVAFRVVEGDFDRPVIVLGDDLADTALHSFLDRLESRVAGRGRGAGRERRRKTSAFSSGRRRKTLLQGGINSSPRDRPPARPRRTAGNSRPSTGASELVTAPTRSDRPASSMTRSECGRVSRRIGSRCGSHATSTEAVQVRASVSRSSLEVMVLRPTRKSPLRLTRGVRQPAGRGATAMPLREWRSTQPPALSASASSAFQNVTW